MMREQLAAVVGILRTPKHTLASLPSDRFYLLSAIIYLYFSYASLIRKGTLAKVAAIYESWLIAYLFPLVLSVFLVPLGAFVCLSIVRLFGKRVTMVRVMNLFGFALVPRFVVSVLLSVIFATIPETLKVQLLSTDQYEWLSLVVAVFGVIILLYCIYLFFWGIVLSPVSVSSHEGSVVENHQGLLWLVGGAVGLCGVVPWFYLSIGWGASIISLFAGIIRIAIAIGLVCAKRWAYIFWMFIIIGDVFLLIVKLGLLTLEGTGPSAVAGGSMSDSGYGIIKLVIVVVIQVPLVIWPAVSCKFADGTK